MFNAYFQILESDSPVQSSVYDHDLWEQIVNEDEDSWAQVRDTMLEWRTKYQRNRDEDAKKDGTYEPIDPTQGAEWLLDAQAMDVYHLNR